MAHRYCLDSSLVNQKHFAHESVWTWEFSVEICMSVQSGQQSPFTLSCKSQGKKKSLTTGTHLPHGCNKLQHFLWIDEMCTSDVDLTAGPYFFNAYFFSCRSLQLLVKAEAFSLS